MLFRRGLSTFIATFLLLVLVVAIGGVIYVSVMGYMGESRVAVTMGSLSLDSATMVASNVTSQGVLTVYLRNTGEISLTGFVAYIDGVQTATPTMMSPDPLNVGATGKMVILSEFKSGRTYEIKLVAKDGTFLAFSKMAS